MDWTAAIVGLIMSLNLAVVAFILSFYLDEAPQYRGDIPVILQSTLLFGLLGAAGIAAGISVRREKNWRWLAQGGVALTVAAVVWFIVQFLAG